MNCPSCGKYLDPYRTLYSDEIPIKKEIKKPTIKEKLTNAKTKFIRIVIFMIVSLTKLLQWLCITIGVITVLTLIGYPIYKNWTTSEVISFCQIESITYNSERSFMLYGIKDWHEDSTIGKFVKLEEAIEAANKLNCQIK